MVNFLLASATSNSVSKPTSTSASKAKSSKKPKSESKDSSSKKSSTTAGRLIVNLVMLIVMNIFVFNYH